MRVKSPFVAPFNKRTIVRFGFLILLFASFLVGSSFREHSDLELKSKQVNIIIRQIGHRLLLQAGDSTSRVMPVTQKKGTFLLTFEKELVFSHDSLMLLSQLLLPKKQFPSGYTITVHDCKQANIVYGFQLNNSTPDILNCSGRTQPKGCYTIEFTFPDFYDTEEKIAAIGPNESNKTQSSKLNQTQEGFETTNSNPRIEKLNLANADSGRVDQKLQGFKMKPFDYVVYCGIVALLGVIFLIGRSRTTGKPVSVEQQTEATIKAHFPELAALGKFLFDIDGQRLVLGSEVIPLTNKECKLLELLHNNFGELIPRETLMQEVWLNEGVITTRSLDMFVSKLRKKLSSDPELSITNVHGKGYKLHTPI